jgi:hypothetical protein
MARDQIIQSNQTAHHRDELFGSSKPANPYRSEPNAPIDRDTMNNWHSVSPVGKVLNTAKDLTGDAIQTSTSVFSSSLGKLKDIATKGEFNGNIKDLLLTFIGGVFGLKTISSLLGAPKYFSDTANKEKHSPVILSAGKLISGAALAYGLLTRVMGGVGLSSGGMLIGMAIFAGLQFFTSLYEDKNSIAGKILDAVGLRDKLVDGLDYLKIETLFTGK